MRYLRWLFIPFLAILLMSHNTSALSFGATDTRSYNFGNLSGAYLTNNENTAYFMNGSNTPSMVYSIDGALHISIPTNTQRINGFQLGFTQQTPTKYIMNVSYRFCPTNPDQLRSWIGFSTLAYNSIVDQQWIINGTCVNGSLSVFGANQRWYIELGYIGGGLNTGSMTAGGSMIFNKPNFIILSDDANYSSVLNAIKNNTDSIKDKLDQLESAAETQQEAAEKELESTESIENQSTSDIDTGDQSSATNLIGNISNIFTQIGNISATNCSIRANFGNLDLGNLNLCTGKENLPFVVTFGAYCFELIFVVGTSIILIKQLLGILDWSRS